MNRRKINYRSRIVEPDSGFYQQELRPAEADCRAGVPCSALCSAVR